MAGSGDIKAGGAYIELFVKDASLIKGLRAASERLQRFGQTVGMIGRSIASAGSIVTGFGALAGASLVPAITAASDLGETISKAGQIFGKEALPELEAFAATAASAMGQTKQQALDAAATFAVFGKAAGLSGEALTGFATELTVLASDLASFGNSTPEEAIVAIGAALRGEAEPIRNYGVLLDDATLRQKALELGIIATTKNALTPQQRVLAAHAVIMEQTADAQGDFARTSDGLANRLRIVNAQWGNLKAIIGEAVLPTVTKVVGVFARVAEVAADWVKGNQEIILTIAKFVPAVVGLGVALTGIGAALAFATTQTGMITFALTGLAAGFIAVGASSEKFRDTVAAALGNFQETVSATGAALNAALDLGDMEAAWDVALQGIRVAWYTMLNDLTDATIAWTEQFAGIVSTRVAKGVGQLGEITGAVGRGTISGDADGAPGVLGQIFFDMEQREREARSLFNRMRSDLEVLRQQQQAADPSATAAPDATHTLTIPQAPVEADPFAFTQPWVDGVTSLSDAVAEATRQIEEEDARRKAIFDAIGYNPDEPERAAGFGVGATFSAAAAARSGGVMYDPARDTAKSSAATQQNTQRLVSLVEQLLGGVHGLGFTE